MSRASTEPCRSRRIPGTEPCRSRRIPGPAQCTERCWLNLFSCAGRGVVRHGCRVSEFAYVEPSDVARLVKLASLLAWCRCFLGMAPGSSGVEAPANGGDCCWPPCTSSSACCLWSFPGMLGRRRRRRRGRGGGGGGRDGGGGGTERGCDVPVILQRHVPAVSLL